MSNLLNSHHSEVSLSLHHIFDSGMHNFVLFTGRTKLNTPAGVWCGYTPPVGEQPGVIQMLYATRESRGHVGPLLGVTGLHSLETYGVLPVGSHDLSCHSFPVQQRLAFILGQIPAQTTTNSEDWFCSLRYLNAWNSSFKTNQGDKLDLALLARGKDFVIEILNSPEGQTPMPTWARAKNDLYSSQRTKNGRMLDRAETQSNQETASA